MRVPPCPAKRQETSEMYEEIMIRQQKIVDYTNRARYYKLPELPEHHNVENYMAAIAITRGLVSKETVCEIATTFGGVEHRLELVREKDGVRFYNSSIDSSPTRTAAALSALSKAPIIILGGSDKNIPFDGLAKDVCEKTKAAIVTGVC